MHKKIAYYLTQPFVLLLARTRISPNAITWLGFLLSLGAGILIVRGQLFAAGWVVLLAGFWDILDGALARYTNKQTRFGGILDSTLDRLSEGVILLAILTLYAGKAPPLHIILIGAVLLGSLLVSYIRARAETEGLECEVGLFTRAERVIVLALGLLLSQLANALVIALAVLGVLSFATVGQRLFHVWQQTRRT